MGQSMCSILEYQTLVDINVVTDNIDLPKRYLFRIIIIFFFRENEIEIIFPSNCNKKFFFFPRETNYVDMVRPMDQSFTTSPCDKRYQNGLKIKKCNLERQK